jgi:hypothetical protein
MNGLILSGFYFLLISLLFFVSGISYNCGYKQNTKDLIANSKNATVEYHKNGEIIINKFIRKDKWQYQDFVLKSK